MIKCRICGDEFDETKNQQCPLCGEQYYIIS
jgi:rRNA maturation endonuclease Nob1